MGYFPTRRVPISSTPSGYELASPDTKGGPIPRFAANLGWLFAERPFLERFGAAAAAGFRSVELLSPYEHAPATVRAELARFGLSQLGINTPLGREGESGLAALPGRER